MSTSKAIDRICVAVLICALILTTLFMNGSAIGIQASEQTIGYENRLFDPSRVHTIDIVADDWDSFIDTCENEEYIDCAVVIDGHKLSHVGLRAKGNTSLTQVRSMNSERYSFKIEFDHNDPTQTYYGLDKLCLNNIIQDNTYMKDFVTYRMMDEFGVNAPLTSYAWITVNGSDWGLYLAVEAVEDSFLTRNYGADSGNLYKPDSMNMGGGRGNGREFQMDDFMKQLNGETEGDSADGTESTAENAPEAVSSATTTQPGGMTPPDGMQMPGGMTPPDGPESTAENAPEAISSATTSQTGEDQHNREEKSGKNRNGGRNFNGFDGNFKGFGGGAEGGGKGGFGGGMGSSDVKLQYIDDEVSSYNSIFSSAKTDPTKKDQETLIASLKTLSESTDADSVVDVDQVLRYFVVHNYVVNGDSYTGGMIHNYYLHELDGVLSMIPWDYNLAFGGFQSGSASGTVNDPIDSPLNTGNGDSRPMIDWIFSSEEYTELYHEYFRNFLDTIDLNALVSETAAMIAPYVEKDPTKFCTCEEFETGTKALSTFAELRTESVLGQLDGTIPSTSDGQSEDSSALVDASGLTISDMGSMGMGGGKGGPDGAQMQGGMTPPDGMQMPEGMTPPDGMQMPEGMTPPDGMQMPEGMTPPDGMQMPEGMTPPDGAQ